MIKPFLVFLFVLGAFAFSPAQSLPSGQKIYQSKCKRCHGADGAKGASGAKNLKISNMKSQEIKYIVSNGKKPMPAYKKISAAELDSLVVYVKALRKA